MELESAVAVPELARWPRAGIFRSRQAALRYSLIKPWTTCLRVILPVMSIACRVQVAEVVVSLCVTRSDSRSGARSSANGQIVDSARVPAARLDHPVRRRPGAYECLDGRGDRIPVICVGC